MLTVIALAALVVVVSWMFDQRPPRGWFSAAERDRQLAELRALTDYTPDDHPPT